MSSLNHLRNAAEERKNKYPEILNYPADIMKVKQPVFVGDFSLTALGGGVRWLKPSACIRPFGFKQTVTELTRDYISSKYDLPLRVRHEQIQAVSDIPNAPMMAIPGYHGDCVYIDIKSAYWQIVRAVGWDVAYYPGKYIGVGSDHSDAPEFLIKQKLFRASMVSMCRNRDSWIFDGKGNMTLHKMANKFINYRLARFVMDILNGVASHIYASYAHPVYINTDGYIVPRRRMETALDILSGWGFECSVKYEGATTVYGVGSYKIGGFSTDRPGNNLHFSNLYELDYRWLRERFVRFTELYHDSN